MLESVDEKDFPVHEGHEQYMKRRMKEEEMARLGHSKDFIWVTFQKEGIHKYPAAEDIPGVEFLAHPHRHMFHFRVELQVMHDDRDVEFILFKRELEALYDKGTMQLDYKSCEMMARELAGYIRETYPNRDLAIEVSEDGENGCRLNFPNV